MLRLNMLLLFLVAIEPYLFNILIIQNSAVSMSLASEVSAFYALDIGAMNFVLAYFTYILTQEEKKLIPTEMIKRFKVSRNSLTLTG